MKVTKQFLAKESAIEVMRKEYSPTDRTENSLDFAMFAIILSSVLALITGSLLGFDLTSTSRESALPVVLIMAIYGSIFFLARALYKKLHIKHPRVREIMKSEEYRHTLKTLWKRYEEVDYDQDLEQTPEERTVAKSQIERALQGVWEEAHFRLDLVEYDQPALTEAREVINSLKETRKAREELNGELKNRA